MRICDSFMISKDGTYATMVFSDKPQQAEILRYVIGNIGKNVKEKSHWIKIEIDGKIKFIDKREMAMNSKVIDVINDPKLSQNAIYNGFLIFVAAETDQIAKDKALEIARRYSENEDFEKITNALINRTGSIRERLKDALIEREIKGFKEKICSYYGFNVETIEQACFNVLKHTLDTNDDYYNGLVASIESALRESTVVWEEWEYNETARKIADRIIGNE